MPISNPKITVLMPVYNRGHLLKQSIQSIFDQTFEDWELLIIDDGSTDNTWQIIQEASDLDPRIRGHRIKHQGLVGALTVGNQMASADIIVKQDSDDVSLPNRLEGINSYFTMHPNTDLLYHGMYQLWVESDLQHIGYFPALPFDKERLLKEQYIPGCFAYSKKFILEVPYRKNLYCSEDWMLLLDAVLRNRNVHYWNEGLYMYYLQVDSNSVIHEGTGHYEADEKEMGRILKEEYGITDFKYGQGKTANLGSHAALQPKQSHS